MRASRDFIFLAATNELHPSFQSFNLTQAPPNSIQHNHNSLFTPINHHLTSQITHGDEHLDCVTSSLDGSLIGLSASGVDSMVTTLPMMTQPHSVDPNPLHSGRQSVTGSASPNDVTAVLTHEQATQLQSTLTRLTSPPSTDSSHTTDQSPHAMHSPNGDAILGGDTSPRMTQATG